MSYFDSLSAEQKKRVYELDKELKKFFKSKAIRAGIIATITKESGFTSFKEITYANTPNSAIRIIFGSRVAKYNDTQLNALKKDYTKFFNEVYGNEYGRVNLGNVNAGDGSKFVGRGYNSITGRANYRNVGKSIGVDLENNPQLLERADILAKASANYFKNSFDFGKSVIKARYGVNDVSLVKDIKTAAKIAHNANMGWKNPPETDTTGGYRLTMARVEDIYNNLDKQSTKKVPNEVKKKKPANFILIAGLGFATAAGYLLYRSGKLKKFNFKKG
jgi:putative chitinase